MGITAYLGVIDGMGIVALGAAVFDPVGRTDGKTVAVGQNVGVVHLVGKESDLDFGTDELHGHIIRAVVNGDGGV